MPVEEKRIMMRLFRSSGGWKGALIDIIIMAGLLTCIYLFLRRMPRFGATKRKHSQSGSDQEESQGESDDATGDQRSYANLIEARIKVLGEQRSEDCAKLVYDVKEQVTIVLDFNDYQFYNLKSTISSILKDGETTHIAEIIVLDDGSTLGYIQQEADQFVMSVPRARLIRNKEQHGQVRCRQQGFNEARTDIVVFLDVNTICSRGWLEPLIDLLVKKPECIAVPHYDLIHDPVTMDYRQTAINVVSYWTWQLSIKMKHWVDDRIKKSVQYVVSPAIRGNVFAVRRKHFEAIGMFDQAFDDGGGEYLDLSLRAWLCGGVVMKATCSRVGIVNLQIPVKTRSKRNMRYLAERYFGRYKEALYNLNDIFRSNGTIPNQVNSLDLSKCQDMDWYLKNIKNESFSPTENAKYFGILKVHSGRCAEISAKDSKIDLEPCENDPSSGTKFMMTSSGQVIAEDGRCLSSGGTAYMIAEQCRAKDSKQLWHYNKENELVNAWSNYCARHVTDPEKGPEGQPSTRQIAMAQVCKEPNQPDHFQRWTFFTA